MSSLSEPPSHTSGQAGDFDDPDGDVDVDDPDGDVDVDDFDEPDVDVDVRREKRSKTNLCRLSRTWLPSSTSSQVTAS